MSASITIVGAQVERDAADAKRLHELASGRPVERKWGHHASHVFASLFGAPDTMETYACTQFARDGNATLGYAVAFPSEEFPARSQSTRSHANARIGTRLRWRAQFAHHWRGMRGSRLGPPEPEGFYLAALAVFEEAQRRGVGSTLLRHVSHQAVESGKKHLALDVASKNSTARTFYEGFGFRSLGPAAGGVLKLVAPLPLAALPLDTLPLETP